MEVFELYVMKRAPREELHVPEALRFSLPLPLQSAPPYINTPPSWHLDWTVQVTCHSGMHWVATLSFFLRKSFLVTKHLVDTIFQSTCGVTAHIRMKVRGGQGLYLIHCCMASNCKSGVSIIMLLSTYM